MKKSSKNIILLLVVLILINLIATQAFKRFDFTEDQRYSLSNSTKEIIESAETPVKVKVYLTGDLPSVFKRLQLETQYILEEYAAYNPQIKFEFVNPVDEDKDAMKVATAFYQQGMTPETLNVIENGKTTENIIFPWAEATQGDKKVKIQLLNKQLGANNEEMVNASVQNLEYQFSDAFNKLLFEKEKKVAVLRGKDQLEDKFIADFFGNLREYYFIAPFTLEPIEEFPEESLEKLNEFDLIIDAKSTKTFTEKEKYVLDQYLMNGGKALWLTEQVQVEKDSLYKDQTTLAFPKKLNMYDFFFTYGIRINPQLVNDLYSAPIILAQGKGRDAQFNPFPWFYEPLAKAASSHPIVTNIDAVHFNFANPIELLENDIKKTPLLQSSPLTKLEGVPKEISLEMVNKEPNPESYQNGSQVLAVLLEGEFKSLYKDRVLPFDNENHIDKSKATQQIVISDGDVIKNEVEKGKPQELGFDRYSGNVYGNKDFLLNAINFMLDDSGLVELRSKQITMAKLDQDKVDKYAVLWKIINVLGGIIAISVFGIILIYLRKKKYVK
ncbi:MAG: gliding motility-associated ABC transporter substrate-binding protein GldG [Bacteroidota bacterium]